MRYSNKRFTNEQLTLDGNSFVGCTFLNCELAYCGGAPPSLNGCHFETSRISFNGPAGNTMNMLKAMAEPHSGFQDVLIEQFAALLMLRAEIRPN